MNCLVLGGAGFIGQHLCRALSAAGNSVLAFDLPRDRGVDWPAIDGVVWISGRMPDAPILAEKAAQVDCVFHLVSSTIPQTSNENPLADLRENVAGTLQFLDLLKAQRRSPRLIFLSSGGTVYGIPEQLPISEQHPTNPICAYGVGKLAIEKYLLLYRHLYDLDALILRVSNPYGFGQNARGGQGAITAFLYRALRDEPLEIWGDGNIVRDYLYIDDLCRALLSAQHYSGSEQIFNIGSGRGHSLNELAETLGDLLGRRPDCIHRPARDCDVPVNVLDIQRARRCLGWQPEISLEAGLARYRQHLATATPGC